MSKLPSGALFRAAPWAQGIDSVRRAETAGHQPTCRGIWLGAAEGSCFRPRAGLTTSHFSVAGESAVDLRSDGKQFQGRRGRGAGAMRPLLQNFAVRSAISVGPERDGRRKEFRTRAAISCGDGEQRMRGERSWTSRRFRTDTRYSRQIRKQFSRSTENHDEGGVAERVAGLVAGCTRVSFANSRTV